LPARVEADERSECVLSDREYVDVEELELEADELDVDVEVEVDVDVEVEVDVELLEEGVAPEVTVNVAVTTDTTLEVSVTACVMVWVPAVSLVESYGFAPVAGPPLKSYGAVVSVWNAGLARAVSSR
jgi:hypothetical protein